MRAAGANGLHLPAFEREAGLQAFLDKIVVERFPVLDDAHAYPRLACRDILATSQPCNASSASVLVPYSAQQMFDLVDDVERYPEFLPWCGGSKVLQARPERQDGADRHRLPRRDGAFHDRQRQQAARVDRHGVEGRAVPQALTASGRSARSRQDACKVEFSLSYEFKNNVLETLVGPVFNQIAHTFIDAFVRRAEARYAK